MKDRVGTYFESDFGWMYVPAPWVGRKMDADMHRQLKQEAERRYMQGHKFAYAEPLPQVETPADA